VTPVAVDLPLDRILDLVARRTGLTLGEERVQRGTLVVVRKVARGSAGAEAGIEPGDLVREVNSSEVSTVAELRKAAARARRSGRLVLLVQRGYAAERIAFEFD
jgi:S1-C subfamily serine protease